MSESILVIACGALAREITALKKSYGWDHLHLACIDAKLHHRPALILDCLRMKIRSHKKDFDRIYVAYADCGTNGEIDRVIEEEASRLESGLSVEQPLQLVRAHGSANSE